MGCSGAGSGSGSCPSAGVRGINLREGDEVVEMAIVDPMASLLTVCENGYGKRTSFEEYRVQGRGGYGIINIKANQRNGKVVGMKSIRENDELMLITLGGMIVRTGVNELRMIGRATQGVRVIALKEGDKLTAVARVVTDDSNQGDLPIPPAPAQGELPRLRPPRRGRFRRRQPHQQQRARTGRGGHPPRGIRLPQRTAPGPQPGQ